MASNNTFPALRWKAITAGAAAIEPVPVAIWADVAGDITCVGDDGVSVSFTIPAGQPISLQPHKITAATATGLRALYN